MAVEVARESFPRRVSAFYQDVLAEMKKVAWPDRAQVRQATVGIIIIVLLVSAIIGVLDLIIQTVLVRWLPPLFSGPCAWSIAGTPSRRRRGTRPRCAR